MEINKIRTYYRHLKESGMFWEIHPEMTGNWEDDHKEFVEKMRTKMGMYDKAKKYNIEPESNNGVKEVERPQPFHQKVQKWEKFQQELESEEMDAVTYIERKFPEMAQEFKRIQKEQYITFCKKQRNYGPGNISVGSRLETEEEVKVSLTGIWFRVNDKIQRLKQLVVMGEPDEVGESAQDSFDDMSIYGIIAQIVSNGKWAK